MFVVCIFRNSSRVLTRLNGSLGKNAFHVALPPFVFDSHARKTAVKRRIPFASILLLAAVATTREFILFETTSHTATVCLLPESETLVKWKN